MARENLAPLYEILNTPLISSEELCSRLGIQCVAEVVRHGRFRWFGNLECRKEDDWVSSCRDMEVASLNLRAGAGRFGGGWPDNCLGCILSDQYSYQGYVKNLDNGRRSNPSLAWEKSTILNKRR